MSPLSLVSGLGMMCVALAAAVYWQRHKRVRVSLFLLGALAWVVGNVLKSVAAIPFPAMTDAMRATLPRYVSEPLLWLYIGFLTGIFECVTVLAFAHIRGIRCADRKGAIAFGLGFGAIEAVVLGAYSFVTVLLVQTAPDLLPVELVEAATSQGGSLLIIPVPIVERALVLLVHTFSCVVIIYAVQTRAWKWFWLSFLYKTTLDTIAGSIQLTVGVQNLTTFGTWAVELVLLPFGILGLLGLRALRCRWPQEATPSVSHDEITEVQSGAVV
jgi:uncharacterized membrane protein YhfC